MTFKRILPQLQEFNEGSLGLVVVKLVIENRVRHKKLHRDGELLDFANKEMKCVHDGLEEIAGTPLGERSVPTAQSLYNQYGEDPLGYHRNVATISYLYNVLKALHQVTGGSDAERITTCGEFLARYMRACTITRPETMTAYDWDRETTRQEYIRILRSMRNPLNDETGIIRDVLR